MQGQPLEIVTTVRPGPAHIIPAIILAVLLLACGTVLLPFANILLPSNPSFLPAFGAMILVVDLITAILLLGQAQIAGHAPTLRLGTAYLFSAMIVVPHMAAFPSVVAEQPLLGTSASAVWLWVFWHTGFALMIIWYAAIPAAVPAHAKLPVRAGTIFAAVVALAVIASAGLPWLPSLLQGNTYERLNTLGIGPFVMACNVAALALVVFRLRFRTIMSLWLTVALLAACVDVGNTLFGLTRFSVGWYLGRVGALLTGLCVLGALLFESLHLFGRVAETNRALERLATTDGLTHIPNRRAFDITLDTEWRRGTRDNSELSLLLLDIDWFKGFNDHYGHLGGDDCLQRVAAAIQGALRRAADFAARYGGEEFAVILPGTDTASAEIIAERIRGVIGDIDIPHQRSSYGHVTVSIGVATAQPRHGGSIKGLIDRADAALYRSKASGRNRASVAPAPPAVVEPAAATS